MESKETRPESIRSINEIERVAIVLPEGTTFYDDQRFVAVAWEAAAMREPIRQVIGSHRNSLPFLAPYELVNHLCGDRAMRTVDGSLRVNGQIITPERYLGLWRAALQHPLTATQFTQRYGQQVLLVLGGPVTPLRGQRSSWTSSPFAHFDDFEATYRDRIDYRTDESGEHFEIALDLCEPNAARDAFYAASFIRGTELEKQGQVEVRLQSGHPAKPQTCAVVTQSELFVEAI